MNMFPKLMKRVRDRRAFSTAAEERHGLMVSRDQVHRCKWRRTSPVSHRLVINLRVGLEWEIAIVEFAEVRGHVMCRAFHQ